MRETICLLVLLVLALGTCQAGDVDAHTIGLVGRWIGATDFTGAPVQIDLRLHPDGNGVLDVYFQAPMGFDFKGMRLDVTQEESGDESARFAVSYRGSTRTFIGRLDGHILHGEVEGGDQPARFRLFRCIESSADELTPTLGFYRVGGHRFGTTWREYGDLRWIDLDTGTGTTLIPTSSNAFILADSLVDFPRQPSRVEIHGDAVRLAHESGVTSGKRLASPRQRRIRIESGDVSLAGTLLTPDTRGPHPAIVLVHGSGPIYRTALFERAARFAAIGVATLIYDKRGTGQSTGHFDANFEVLAADVVAAVRRLGQESDIDPRRIGLQGHSQAGFVIPIAAARSDGVAFAIVISGGPITPAEQSLYDKKNDLARDGFGAAETEQALSLMRRLFDYVVARKGDRDTLERDYLAAKQQVWFEVTDLPDVPGIPDWNAPPPEMLAWRAELTYDASTFLASLKIPLLFVFGEADATVPPERTADLVRQALAGRDTSSYRIRTVPGADHGLRIETGDGARTLAPTYVDIQRRFLLDHGVLDSKRLRAANPPGRR